MITVKFKKDWINFKKGQVYNVTCNMAHGLEESGVAIRCDEEVELDKRFKEVVKKKRVRKYKNKRIKKYNNK